MKRLTLLAPKADRDKLLRALQRLGCVEITAPQADEAAFAETQATGAEQTAEQMRRIQWALTQLKRFDTAGKPMFGLYPEATAEQAARLLTEEMEGVMQLSVPLVAEAHWGKNWLEAKG